MEDKPHIENGEDAEFRKLLAQVLTHERPRDALLENPVLSRRLMLICRTLADNKEGAEELFDVVLFAVWQNLFEFQPDYTAPYGNFFAWVRVIARNKFFDSLRPKSLSFSDKRPDELKNLAHGKISTEKEYERRQLVEELQRFSSELEDEKEHKLMKYFLAGNSFRSIANKMHDAGMPCSHVTVQKIIRQLLSEFFSNNRSQFDVARKSDKLSGSRGKPGMRLKETGS